MQDKCSVTEFHHRTKEIRKIAQGIFDMTEREFLLKFVDDCEKLVAPSGKKPT
jgi:hypothetical protein